MKGRIVSGVVAVVGLIVLCATVAQAGGGQGGSSVAAFFQCQSIHGGTNVGEKVSIFSSDGLTDLAPKAIVGEGVLVCRQVQVQVKGTTDFLSALPGDHLDCYQLDEEGKPSPVDFIYQDAFFPTGVEHKPKGSRYLCATSSITFP